MSDQPNCEQRIGDHMRGRMADIRTLVSLATGRGMPDLYGTPAADLDLPEPDKCTQCGGEGWVTTGTAVEPGTEECDLCDGSGTDDDGDEQQEAAQERIYEYPLGVSAKTVFRIELSTGGPGDWFEVECNDITDNPAGPSSYEVETITYHFNDWFDHAERQLSEFDGEFAEAEEFARMLIPELMQ